MLLGSYVVNIHRPTERGEIVPEECIDSLGNAMTAVSLVEVIKRAVELLLRDDPELRGTTVTVTEQ